MPPSTFYLAFQSGNTVEVEMCEGDGCLYAGSEIVHWRESFCGDGYIQLFLHFIAQNGPNYPRWAFDGRDRLGQ